MSTNDLAREDRALDTVAALLRIWARQPFNLPSREGVQIARELESWALHLLAGYPRPGTSDDRAEHERRGKLALRDWAGAEKFAAALRDEEAAFVRQALSDFRQTVEGMVARVREAIAEERVLDSRLEEQLKNLRVAAAGDDLRALRQAADRAADAVTALLGAHKNRQAAQEVEMTSRLHQMGERLHAAEQAAEEDSLTGLANRRGFDSELLGAAQIAGQFNVSSTLLIIDLDHFKKINDSYGHPGGDAALKAVANQLIRAFPRRSDCVARYGGEEFAVILRDSRPGESMRLAHRFLDGLRTLRVRHDEREFQLTASIGVAECRAGETAEGWLARADAALYLAKQAGRDRAVLG